MSPEQLLRLLDRLHAENLHGPTNTMSRTSRASSTRNSLDRDFFQLSSGDMDAGDPRWLVIFKETFIDAAQDDSNDDLLFFVQDSLAIAQSDILIVKRKVAGAGLPTFDPSVSIDWKQTFFLNLISQVSCHLTVAICEKSIVSSVNKEDQGSELLLNQALPPKTLPSASSLSRIVEKEPHGISIPRDTSLSQGEAQAAGSAPETSPLSHQTKKTMPTQGTDALVHPLMASQPLAVHSFSHALQNIPPSASPQTPDTPRDPFNDSKSNTKSRMIAKQRIVKKVYSAPYKSRMDIKDAFMNECSYPLVYYTVNDYESSSLHLPIGDKEYLCVELSIFLPKGDNPTTSYTSMTRPSSATISPLSADKDTTPFPTPPNTHKIVLFQGAVPYTSLSDVYSQKGLAAQNALKLSWSRLNPAEARSDNRSNHSQKRTEYIMMRGPRGKGQCQVAISSLPTEEEEDDRKIRGIADRLKRLGGAVKMIMGTDKTRSEDTLVQGLMASITYVNIAWASIVNDLLEFAKETRSSRSP